MQHEWWNDTQMHDDERAIERREHQLKTMRNGHVIKVESGTKDYIREQLNGLIDMNFRVRQKYSECYDENSPTSLYLLTDEQLDHLVEYGYVKDLNIVLSTDFLIDDNSVMTRPPLIVDFMGYADEWPDQDNNNRG